jgi:biopolymer transport protein ExbD/biopolymer transport protein TolR
VNIHDLGANARAQMKDPSKDSVYLRADEKVPFGIIATVLDTLKQSGIANVNIVTQPLNDRSSTH